MKQSKNTSPTNLARALGSAFGIREPLLSFAEIRAANAQLRERSPDI
jgi:hypothetical protein